jgi:ubiquinone/menaquinone biosynthesis C-methylase UbiE
VVRQIDWSGKRRLRNLRKDRPDIYNEDYMELLARRLKLRNGTSLADVGCGLGFLGFQFIENVLPDGSYVGYDANPKLLKMARADARKAGVSHAMQFRKGEAYSIPARTGRFDVTMCQTLLMHLREPRRAAEEMARITKPGGLVMAMESAWNRILNPMYFIEDGSHLDLSPQLVGDMAAIAWAAQRGYDKRRKDERKTWMDTTGGWRVPIWFRRAGLANLKTYIGDRWWVSLAPYNDGERRRRDQMVKLIRKWLTDAERHGKKYRETIELLRSGGLSRKRAEVAVKRVDEYHRRIADLLEQEKIVTVQMAKVYITIGGKPG